MPYLVGYVTPQDYGAVGDGVTDDTTAINNALAGVFAAGGGTLFIPIADYLVSGTLSVPPYVQVLGQVAISLNLGALPSNTPRFIASASWSPGSATGVFSFLSKTPGGWGVTAQSSVMKNVYIDCSLNASTNLNGIFFQGPVYDTHLEDVYIASAPHNGVHAVTQSESGITATFPYHQRWSRVTSNLAANTGFNLVNFTDSTFTNCLGFASVSNNYGLQNNSNCVFSVCRAEWSSNGRGFDITGSAGSVVFDGCTTDQNFDEGIRIHAATGQSTNGGGIIINGGKLHLDGNGGTNSNGIKITGSTVPVVVSGLNVESGLNGSNYPTTAIEIDTSSNITVTGCVLQGTTNAWLDGGGNTNLIRTGCIGMTGSPNTQTTAILPNINIELITQPTASGNTVLSANVNGTQSFDPLRILGSGQIAIGTGSAARDAFFGRGGTNTAYANPNLLIGAQTALGDNGNGELQLANTTSAPSTNPTGGALVYARNGGLLTRDPNGTVSTIISDPGGQGATTGAISESVPRIIVTTSAAPVSGTLYIQSTFIPAGISIGHIGFATGTTAASGPTHWWAALLDNTYKQQAHSTDQTTGAIAASTWFNLAMATPFVTTYTGTYYLALLIATSTTQPTILQSSSTPAAQFWTGTGAPTPLPNGASTASLTAPGTDGTTTYAAPTTASAPFYLYCSA